MKIINYCTMKSNSPYCPWLDLNFSNTLSTPCVLTCSSVILICSSNDCVSADSSPNSLSSLVRSGWELWNTHCMTSMLLALNSVTICPLECWFWRKDTKTSLAGYTSSQYLVYSSLNLSTLMLLMWDSLRGTLYKYVYLFIFTRVIFALLHLQTFWPWLEFAQT